MRKTRLSPSDFWHLLNLIEDYLRSGFKRDNAEPLHSSGSGSETQLEENSGLDPVQHLDRIEREIAQCKKCDLWRNRRKPVPGAGSVTPWLMVIGEGPGEAEDRSGQPFVGPAGQYLDKWLAAVKIGPQNTPLGRNTNTFIANIVKCRPPNNRDPKPAESSACLPYLERQIGILKPRAILSVGRISSQILTGSSLGISAQRGRVHRYRNIPLIPTYHPSAVLRNTDLRAPVWEDLKLLRSVLESSLAERLLSEHD
jgi:uracil-DNA glycosylase family 4